MLLPGPTAAACRLRLAPLRAALTVNDFFAELAANNRNQGLVTMSAAGRASFQVSV